MEESSAHLSVKQQQQQAHLIGQEARQRNMDHLEFDENLFDHMKSLIPFNLLSSNKSVNKYILGEQGLEKNHYLNVYYNDEKGKRELVYDLILSGILPKEWSQDDVMAPDGQQQNQGATDAAVSESQTNAATGQQQQSSKQIDEGQELQCVLIDIGGQFCARKFMEKVREAYDKHNLAELLGPQPSKEQIDKNKMSFVHSVLANLVVLPCMDAIEFNLVARSLSEFMRRNKSVGLLVIDGMQFIESSEILAAFEKRQVKQKVNAKHHGGTTVDALAAGTDILPSGYDFFDIVADPTGSGAKKPPRQQQQLNNPEVHPSSMSAGARKQQNFYVQKVQRTARNQHDPKVFDQSLVDTALAVINELQKVYQFAIVKTQARPFMRKAAYLQEEVMNKGIKATDPPKTFLPQSSAQDSPSSSQLPGYGQKILDAQIETDDDSLRDRIRQLQTREVLILRGDRDNSLVPQSGSDLNEILMKQHLSCMIVPHTEFQARSRVQTSYLSRYLAVYVLFKIEENLFTVRDDVVKAFYI